MKNLITLTLLALNFYINISDAKANDYCLEILSNHLETIENSEAFFKDLNTKKQRISSYEIIKFQKTLEDRYVGLNGLLNYYEDKNNECPSVYLAQAVAVYDFKLIGLSVLENKSLRRVYNSFLKLNNNRLINLKKDFKVYSSKKYINALNENLKYTDLEIPENIRVEAESFWKRPSFLTFGDVSASTITGTVSGLARVWGYVSDHMIWRGGRLAKNKEARRMIEESLKPLDIIYEKKKFTLSNLTIPGHWGHTAVWLGTKEELIEQGIWDAPFFEKFQRYILDNKNIVEVRKEGVEFKSLDEFMNLDEIAITRVRNIENDYYSITESLMSQYGKKYDFRFDAHSIDRITCTEFITFSYGDLNWYQSKILFQMNIKPDDIARSTFGKNSTSDLVIYLQGQKDGSYVSKSFAGWLKDLKAKKKNLSFGDLNRITENEMQELELMKSFHLDADESIAENSPEEENEDDLDDKNSVFNLAPHERAIDISPELIQEIYSH